MFGLTVFGGERGSFFCQLPERELLTKASIPQKYLKKHAQTTKHKAIQTLKLQLKDKM